MGESNDLDFDFRFSVDDCVRKPAQWQAPRSAFDCHAWDGHAELRMAFNQLQRAFNIAEKFSAESGASIFVPRDNRPQFVASRVLNAEGFAHLRRISALIWRRTSSQAVVPVVPLSSAMHRRSISAAHAASISAISSSPTVSKLSIKRAAMSARSRSERANASCNSLSAMAVIQRTIASGTKLTKRLQATLSGAVQLASAGARLRIGAAPEPCRYAASMAAIGDNQSRGIPKLLVRNVREIALSLARTCFGKMGAGMICLSPAARRCKAPRSFREVT